MKIHIADNRGQAYSNILCNGLNHHSSHHDDTVESILTYLISVIYSRYIPHSSPVPITYGVVCKLIIWSTEHPVEYARGFFFIFFLELYSHFLKDACDASSHRYINNNCTKDRCFIPMYMTVLLGLHKFNLQATIDHHGPFMYSGHYATSINCKKNTLLQRQ